MKITAVEVEVWHIPFEGEVRPSWSPGRVWKDISTSVYRVQTDEGIIGIAAGSGVPQFVHERVAPLLVGQDPFNVNRLTRTLINNGIGLPITNVVEVALWDILGKAANLPLYQLWGAHTDRIRAYASLIEVRTPEGRAEDVLKLLDRGYTAVKLRLHSESMKEDLAQVEAVRKAVGNRMSIMVDANQAQEPGTQGSESDLVWSYERALKTCRELAQYDVAWMEEPLGRFHFDSLARLTANTEIPIAGGENNIGMHEFRTLIDQNVYDIIQPDALVGMGLSQIRKIANYAELHHKQMLPHHGGNGLGVAAHLHLSASLPNSPFVELLQEPPVLEARTFQGLLAEPLLPGKDGFVRLPQGPGLGVELRTDLKRIG